MASEIEVQKSGCECMDHPIVCTQLIAAEIATDPLLNWRMGGPDARSIHEFKQEQQGIRNNGKELSYRWLLLDQLPDHVRKMVAIKDSA